MIYSLHMLCHFGRILSSEQFASDLLRVRFGVSKHQDDSNNKKMMKAVGEHEKWFDHLVPPDGDVTYCLLVCVCVCMFESCI